MQLTYQLESVHRIRCRRGVLAAGIGLLAGSRLGLAQEFGRAAPRVDVPYVPTPQPVVNGMLRLAKVGKGDVVYDLGCGDGRIVITAAVRYGARGVGIDIDRDRIQEARRNADDAGVSRLVQFRQEDLFQANFSPATVVMLYLLPELNLKLRPQLWRQLKVGTRIVSHTFDMGEEWPPDRTDAVGNSAIHFWTIRARHKRSA